MMNGALAFFIMDHDPKMTVGFVTDAGGPADSGASSRRRDDTLSDKSTFLPLSVGPGSVGPPLAIN